MVAFDEFDDAAFEELFGAFDDVVASEDLKKRTLDAVRVQEAQEAMETTAVLPRVTLPTEVTALAPRRSIRSPRPARRRMPAALIGAFAFALVFVVGAATWFMPVTSVRVEQDEYVVDLGVNVFGVTVQATADGTEGAAVLEDEDVRNLTTDEAERRLMNAFDRKRSNPRKSQDESEDSVGATAGTESNERASQVKQDENGQDAGTNASTKPVAGRQDQQQTLPQTQQQTQPNQQKPDQQSQQQAPPDQPGGQQPSQGGDTNAQQGQPSGDQQERQPQGSQHDDGQRGEQQSSGQDGHWQQEGDDSLGDSQRTDNVPDEGRGDFPGTETGDGADHGATSPDGDRSDSTFTIVRGGEDGASRDSGGGSFESSGPADEGSGMGGPMDSQHSDFGQADPSGSTSTDFAPVGGAGAGADGFAGAEGPGGPEPAGM